MKKMIDCKEIAERHKQKLKEYIQENSFNKALAVIQVGNNPASNAYVKGKIKDCEEVGIECRLIKFDEEATFTSLVRTISKLNLDKSVAGIIVQLPLPERLQVHQSYILNKIIESKDVDGFQLNSGYTPCTPKGIMTILNELGFDVCSKTCMVIGRSDIVGRPMVKLLERNNATVIWCNSRTPVQTMIGLAKECDVIISATGVAGLINEDWDLNYNTIVIDVGITRGEDGKLYGDVDKKLYGNRLITPVPGGVGLCTRFALLENTVFGH